MLLQVFLGEILEVALGEVDVGGDSDAGVAYKFAIVRTLGVQYKKDSYIPWRWILMESPS